MKLISIFLLMSLILGGCVSKSTRNEEWAAKETSMVEVTPDSINHIKLGGSVSKSTGNDEWVIEGVAIVEVTPDSIIHIKRGEKFLKFKLLNAKFLENEETGIRLEEINYFYDFELEGERHQGENYAYCNYEYWRVNGKLVSKKKTEGYNTIRILALNISWSVIEENLIQLIYYTPTECIKYQYIKS